MLRYVIQESFVIVFIYFLIIPRNARVKCSPLMDTNSNSDELNTLKSSPEISDQKETSSSEKKGLSNEEQALSNGEASLEKKDDISSKSSENSQSSEKNNDQDQSCPNEPKTIQSESENSLSSAVEQRDKSEMSSSAQVAGENPDEKSENNEVNKICKGKNSKVLKKETNIPDKTFNADLAAEPVQENTDVDEVFQRTKPLSTENSVVKPQTLKEICANLPDTVHVNPNSEEIPNQHENKAGFDLSDEEIKKFKIWPQGIIPYYIDHASFDKVQRDRLRLFLEKTNSLTGLRFVELLMPPASSDSRFVFFINRRGISECFDYTPENFTNQRIQRVIVGYNCLTENGGPASAILALVGVPPMHNAPNRDDYIQINKNNILESKKYLFERVKNQDWLFHDVPYDFSSAGHYDWHKYTTNGVETITPKVDIKEDMFSSPLKFSSSDIWKIRMLYNFISKNTHNKVNRARCEQLLKSEKAIKDNVKIFENVTPRKKPTKYINGETKSEVLRDMPKKDRKKIANKVTEENANCSNKASTNTNTEKLRKFKKVKSGKI